MRAGGAAGARTALGGRTGGVGGGRGPAQRRHRPALDGSGAARRGGPFAGGAVRRGNRPDRAVGDGRTASGGRGGEDPQWSRGGGRRRPAAGLLPGDRRARGERPGLPARQTGRWRGPVRARGPRRRAAGGGVLRVPVDGRRRPRASGVRARRGGRLPGRPRRGSPRRVPGDGPAGHAHRRGDPLQGLLGDGVPGGGPVRTARGAAPVRRRAAGAGRGGHGDGPGGRRRGRAG